MSTHRWYDQGANRSEPRSDDGPVVHYVVGWLAGLMGTSTVSALCDRRTPQFNAWMRGLGDGDLMRRRIQWEARR